MSNHDDNNEQATGRNGTPCKHICKDKQNCAHQCCKEGVLGPMTSPPAQKPGGRNLDNELDDEVNKRKKGNDKPADGNTGTENDGNNDAMATLANAITAQTKIMNRIAENSNRTGGNATESAARRGQRKNLKMITTEDMVGLDFSEITAKFMEFENFQVKSNYFESANTAIAFIQDSEIKMIIARFIEDLEIEGTVSKNDWMELCKEIFDRVVPGTNKAIITMNKLVNKGLKARAHGESLQDYFRRFNTLLVRTKWLRNVYNKPNDPEWETETLKSFIYKLKSWASDHVIEMAADRSLHDIVSRLQDLTEEKSLDAGANVGGGGSGYGNRNGRREHFNHMHEDRVDRVMHEEEPARNNAIMDVADDIKTTLFEMRAEINEHRVNSDRKAAIDNANARDERNKNFAPCTICTAPRNQRHTTEPCWFGGQGRNAPPKFNSRQSDNRECYNCGKTGHISRDCRSRKRQNQGGPNGRDGSFKRGGGDDRECYNCGKTGHISRDCRSRNQNSKRARDNSNVECYNCGKPGHFSRECRSPKKPRGDNGGDSDDTQSSLATLAQGMKDLTSKVNKLNVVNDAPEIP